MTKLTNAGLVGLVRADAVGSTALLAAQGLQASIDARRRSTETIVRCCDRGRLLDSRGDSAILAFVSVSDALMGAWSTQLCHRSEHDHQLRVAVTAAEVSGDDLGDTADDRLMTIETLCPPGRVVVDDGVRRAVRAVQGFSFVAGPDDGRGEGLYLLDGVPSELDAIDDLQLGVRAVLFSDVSAPGADGSVTRAVSDRCVEDHGGVVVDSNRAGSVAVFPSCSNAMAAADAVHRAAASASLREDAGPPFRFRVGVSVGDVALSDGAPFGLAVVEAARLLELAAEGCTLSSTEVLTLANGRSGGSVPLGPIELKGLPDPVAVEQTAGSDAPTPLLDLPPALRRERFFPIVGRAEPLAVLDRLWTDAAAGSIHVGVVLGEEGIGKTRLVQELATVAHDAGAIVLHGACDDHLRVPYAPIAEALTRAVALDEELGAAAAGGGGPLGLVLGSARAPQAVGDLSTSDGRAPEQFEVFDSVSEALGRLSRQRPVLLVIDDVQWAEPTTMRMIERIFASEHDARLAVVVTCRIEEIDRDHPAQLLLHATRNGRRAVAVPVDKLTATDVEELLVADRGLAETLIEISGGNPLYIEELVFHLEATDVLVKGPSLDWSLRSDDEGIPIPESVIDLVAHRAARLGPAAVNVLAHAAVMGTSFEIDVLADVVEQPVERVLDVVEQAQKARLIRVSEDGARCAFSDEIVRAAVLRELSPSRRATVHQRIALTLEALYPAQVDRLASHWGASLGAKARSRAISYLRQAGERDMAAAAWEASVDRHRRLLELVTSEGNVENGTAIDTDLDVDIKTDLDIDEAIAGEVHYALGLSLRKLGDEGHREALMRAAELARRAHLGDLLGRTAIAMMRPGVWYPEAGVVDEEIVTLCEDALLLLDPADPLRARVLAALATNLAYAEDSDRCASLLAEAQELAQSSGDVSLIGTTLAAELITFQDPHMFLRRRQVAEEVRQIGRATDDRSLLFVGTCFVVSDLMAAGDFDRAEELIGELSILVEQMREYFPSFLLGQFVTALAIARCQPTATDMIEEVRDRFEPHPVGSFGVAVIQSVVVAAAKGTLSDMLLTLVDAANEYDVPSWALKWNYALSRAHLEAGDHAAAIAAVAANPDPELDTYWLASLYHLGLLGLDVDDPDLCNKVIDRLSPFRGRLAVVGLGVCVVGQISTALGQAYLGLGRLDLAEEHIREAMVQADDLGLPYFATIARRYLAQTLLTSRPSDPEVLALLDDVLKTADRFGLDLEAREAKLLLASVTRPAER